MPPTKNSRCCLRGRECGNIGYFDEAAWHAMVDFVTVYGKDGVRFAFKNRMEAPTKTE